MSLYIGAITTGLVCGFLIESLARMNSANAREYFGDLAKIGAIIALFIAALLLTSCSQPGAVRPCPSEGLKGEWGPVNHLLMMPDLTTYSF